jgi:hypothetical protein
MRTLSIKNSESIILDDFNYNLLSNKKLNVHNTRNDKYIYFKEKVNSVWRTIYIHRFIMNCPKGMCVDHINGNTMDNRLCNLRICSHGQNMCNRRKRTGTSKYIGVVNKRGKWNAQITHNKKTIFIGIFENEIDAAKEYNKCAINFHGEFARLNIIENA